MPRILAVIGGTGFSELSGLSIVRRQVVNTLFGEPSAPLIFGHFADEQVIFLPRHGEAHQLPPHRVNYRANIAALAANGVTHILAFNAVGSLNAKMPPAALVLPDQLIDYTYGRAQTFFEGGSSQDVQHIDFTEPFSSDFREILLKTAAKAEIDMAAGGCLAVTQGPRLETAAEIKKLQREGCDLVGMTTMPEAALAREKNLAYATCALVANWAAGLEDQPITMEEIHKNLEKATENAKNLLSAVLKSADV